MTEIHRLHWGCGSFTPAGWINSDIKQGPGIEISCNILEGLPLDDGSIEYISSQHALQQIYIYDIPKALQELRRVLKVGGVLRLCLPDLDKAVSALHNRQQDYFWCWDWKTVAGNFVTQILDYGFTRTPLNFDLADELLRKAGFVDICRVAYRQTASPYPEIVALDDRDGWNREKESFYVEAFKT